MMINDVEVCDFCEEPLSKDSGDSSFIATRTVFFKMRMDLTDGVQSYKNDIVCNDCVANWMIEDPENTEFLLLEKYKTL